MRLSKLEKLETIQDLTKLKQLKPIPPLTLEEWQKGEIVNGIQICVLIGHLLYQTRFLIDDRPDLTAGEHRLLFYSYMSTIKRLFQLDKEQGYMMKKEFNQIKRDFNIKFEDD